MLRKHGLDDKTIQILEEQEIVTIAAVQGLSEDDLKDLGLPVGQRALLRELVKKLHASFDDIPHSHQSSENENEEPNDNKHNDGVEMNEKQFWCIFKCLGGISAVGIGGILALIGLVTYGLPVIGFGAAGIVAGSLAAKIMALYGGAVASGSVVSVLQSVAMAGIGWKAILGAFFGSAAVMTAVKKTCSHCMDL
ncbi:hypothetical protein CHS0354_019167 [Potamilus streckersoni]|uniref:SAM domain-containing protein n=1 Tax=Potamilus streckersoni TaxID=2493646 RepID=A0AAE0W3X6_9BIVA|nr:hypothetical protein CHS0354_019167 [Potamilus streckersoni]